MATATEAAAAGADVVTLTIPGEPHAQARQRMRIMSVGNRQFVHGYQPAESRNWKAAAQQHMREGFGDRPPFADAVALEVTAFFTCPRSKWRKRDPRPAAWHTSRPDGDNILKAVKDAAKGVLWIDDALVAVATIRKVIAPQGEAPRLVLQVRALAPLPPALGALLVEVTGA